MSHTKNIFSPPGTPMESRTVGELVAERPGRSRVFQSAGIDFCCQGGRTLKEACERRGLSVDSVVEQLEAEAHEAAAPRSNPALLSPPELVRYILDTHHAFLWRELPRLHAMAQRVAHVHGDHTPSLIDVYDVFTMLEEELSSHMMKEEKVLFPAVLAMSRSQTDAMPLDGPIACMIHEHDTAGDLLARLRELTNAYQPPPEACNTYRALFDGLHELEEDLHRHIHLENSVLFPAAQALANGVKP